MGKYGSFQTNGGRIILDLPSAIVAAIAAKEAELRKLTDSNEVFATLNDNKQEATIFAKALNEYREVGRFAMRELPGCCGTVVSYHSVVHKQFRKRGIGSLLLQIREDIALRSGYSALMATVRMDNEEEQKLLSKHGWKFGTEFKNRRTNNDIVFVTKILPTEE